MSELQYQPLVHVTHGSHLTAALSVMHNSPPTDTSTVPGAVLTVARPAEGEGANSTSKPLVLQVISGKYQGGSFPLNPGQDLVIGRGNDVQVVLAEDMVSRRHARISFRTDHFVIEDLSSTNGTFINGEKITNAKLREGDRVLIGTSILKVVSADAAKQSTMEQVVPRSAPMSTAQRRSTSAVRGMTGSLEEIPLPDLLQLLGTSRKSGVLVLRTDQDFGRVYMRSGLVHFATINDQLEIAPGKCLFRMLTWNRGQFDLEPADQKHFDNPLDLSVQAALMEGMRQLDEFNSIKNTLPSLGSRLRLNMPLNPPLRDLTPEQLDVLQVIHNFGYFAQVMNRSRTSDLDTARALLHLLNKGYVRLEQQSPRSLPPVFPST